MRIFCISVIVMLMTLVPSYCQHEAVCREYEKEYVTYPYSDANPIPVFGKIYPYFRYEGFTDEPGRKSWKIVELENDYLRITIVPSIGGKIWSVIDKTTGREMFYGNDVVKFRDVALRGAWTSGGMEINFGVIGHSPSCSFPVNYIVRKNNDGSASCFIGELDLLTRTFWNVEINLPRDKPWFSIRSFWHNRTGEIQPYYHWINAAVQTRDDLEFVYPGDCLIDHNGNSASWPIDTVRHRNLSIWRENDFGSSKSYHILGSIRPFFGAYWKDESFGVLDYTERDNKIGKKIWIWALSDEGKIWSELLTDANGQYSELQSGRLFNQNLPESGNTPFKQISFKPYETETWSERWFPFSGIGGVSNATTTGVVDVTEQDGKAMIGIYPLECSCDTLRLYDQDGNPFYLSPIRLTAAQAWKSVIAIPQKMELSKITYGRDVLWESKERFLSRPVTTVTDFNWNTAVGYYLKGRDYMGFRLYEQAESNIRRSLAMDGNYVPSLVEMSRLSYYHMDYDSAFRFARKALSIDTYDAPANYEYARASLKLGDLDDALDGFTVATLDESFRSAACTELSKMYFIGKEYRKALEYAEKSLIDNQYNVEGLQVAYLASLFLGDAVNAGKIADRISCLEPLNHFIRFERYFNNRTDGNLALFQKYIRDEMPVQTYLELGIWYHSLALDERALSVLQSGPRNAETCYWTAFLEKGRADSAHIDELLSEAALQKADLVFPFREESRDVFKWAIRNQASWQPRYYLALLEASRNNRSNAYDYISSFGNDVGFAPFYSFRSELCVDSTLQEKDLVNAIRVSGGGFRYIHKLARFYYGRNEYVKAEAAIAPLYEKMKGEPRTGLLYVRILLENGEYEVAEKVLEQIKVFPSEGDADGRLLYRRAKLSLAVKALKAGNRKLALDKIAEARLWPRNLGIGKPYDEMIDASLEDELEMMARNGRYGKCDLDMVRKKIELIGRREHVPMF